MGQAHSALLILLLLPSATLAEDRAQDTTICELNSHQGEFAGKMVRVRGRVVQGFEWFFIEANRCRVDLAYPNGPAELGAAAVFQPSPEPRMPVKFQLVRDESYRKFAAYAMEGIPQRSGCVCFSCYRYEVTVTMTGLFQVAKRGHPGFGHLNAARSRLVIRSASDVAAVDVGEKYKDSQCGAPELALPKELYPGWNQPITVPPYSESKSSPR